jgi:hypothetical protein
MELQEQELYQIVFNRNLSENLIKESQITAAKTKWIDAYLPAQFLEDIETDEEFVLNYIKPIWAWGTVYSNFNYISTSITDKGVIQMLVEGTAAVLGTDKLLNTKNEILQTVITLIKRLDTYATEQEELGTAGFENYTGLEIEPMLIKFEGRERYNQTPY